MIKSLTQKSGLKTSTFIIEDTGLLIKTKAKQNETEIHYAFEDIKTNRITTLDHNKATLIIALVFSGITLLVFILSFSDKTVEPVAAPLWATISLALFIFYFRTRSRKVYLQATDNRTIHFTIDKTNINAINDFIEQLLVERNLYLVSKYGNLNRNLEYSTQLNNLNWLLNNRAISKAQYDEKVQELNTLFNSSLSKNQIGFSSNN